MNSQRRVSASSRRRRITNITPTPITRRRGPRLANAVLKAGALASIALLVAGAALPSVAAGAVAPSEPGVVRAAETQTLTATGNETTTAERDSYTVTSWSELRQLRYGTRSYNYSTTGVGPVRWPFPTEVPISSGFGSRAAPCRGCSSNHQGLDFTPGAGAPIYAIADGTVYLHEEGGGFGNHVILEHTINGQRVRSLYAHMQWGSSPLQMGQTVSAGDFVGLVGATGQVTGNHLHFELEVDGVTIDPFTWLKSNAS